MGNISYTAHVSNKKSAITSKSKLAAVAKHNLRKYKSSDLAKTTSASYMVHQI